MTCRLRRLMAGIFLAVAATTGPILMPGPALAEDAIAFDRPADLVLTGTLTGSAHQTYVEVPFAVPEGAFALTVEFAYTGKEQKSVIDLGLRDPERFRGWSGGNKARFTLTPSASTPSYLAGPLPGGTWHLVLGVPNLRSNAQADYVARIWIDRQDNGLRRMAEGPVRSGPGWYRGDLHVHTGHSDASCLSRLGQKVPCPTYKTLEAASARGLDFISITDHNATSQNQSVVELSRYYNDLLIIPGREITTFYGHANVFGPSGPMDFQLGSDRTPNLSTILDQVEAADGLLSINHPGLPSGEACMGCGWTAPSEDPRIAAIEVINGGGLELPPGPLGPFSGLNFWQARLNRGQRTTAIGGSDNHDATRDLAKPQSVGYPTTVVYAEALSQVAILRAIRSGHVFIDVEGSRDRALEVTVTGAGQTAAMGDVLSAPKGRGVAVSIHAVKVANATVRLIGSAAGLASRQEWTVKTDDDTIRLNLTPDGMRRWFRVEVWSAEGRLLLLGNPVYLNGDDVAWGPK